MNRSLHSAPLRSAPLRSAPVGTTEAGNFCFGPKRIPSSMAAGRRRPWQRRNEQVGIIGAGPAGLLLARLLTARASTASSSSGARATMSRPHPRRRAGAGHGRLLGGRRGRAAQARRPGARRRRDRFDGARATASTSAR